MLPTCLDRFGYLPGSEFAAAVQAAQQMGAQLGEPPAWHTCHPVAQPLGLCMHTTSATVLHLQARQRNNTSASTHTSVPALLGQGRAPGLLLPC